MRHVCYRRQSLCSKVTQNKRSGGIIILTRSICIQRPFGCERDREECFSRSFPYIEGEACFTPRDKWSTRDLIKQPPPADNSNNNNARAEGYRVALQLVHTPTTTESKCFRLRHLARAGANKTVTTQTLCCLLSRLLGTLRRSIC